MHDGNPHAICGAKTKSGGTCKNPPMLGKKRCRMHGGATPTGAALPQFKHGRYSSVMPERMRARYAESLADPQLEALRGDIALVDARLEDVLGRVDTGEAGSLWTALFNAWEDFQSARRLGDEDRTEWALNDLESLIGRGVTDAAAWAEVMGLIERRRKLVESELKRLEKMQQVLTIEQAMTLVAAVQEAVRRNVRDRGILAAIEADLSRIVGQSTP